MDIATSRLSSTKRGSIPASGNVSGDDSTTQGDVTDGDEGLN